MASHMLAVLTLSEGTVPARSKSSCPACTAGALLCWGSVLQQAQDGSGCTKLQQSKAAINQINLSLQTSASPSTPSAGACVLGAAVDIYDLHGAMPGRRAVSRATVSAHEHVFACEQSQSDLWIWSMFSLSAQKRLTNGCCNCHHYRVTRDSTVVLERAEGQAAS